MRERLAEIIRFGMVGVLATAIHYAIYYLLLPVADHNVAYTVGYVISFVCNYVFSSLFTFRVAMSLQKLVNFGVSHALNYLIGIALLNAFVLLGVPLELAPLPVFVLVVPVNYLLVRFAITHREGRHESYLLFLLLAGLAMLWLNFQDVPTLSDDMVYRFQWSDHEGDDIQPITSLGDLLRSQCVHYLTVNGRMPVHTLAQFFLAFVPPVVLQLLNTVLFVLLLHLCTVYVGRQNQRLTVAVAVCFLLFMVFRGFRTAMLWSIGSFNYLWVLVATMAFLLWIRRQCDRQYSGLAGWLMMPLALFVGWSHEGLSLPLSAAFVVWLWGNRNGLHGKTVQRCLWFYMAGTALCLLSPGIWNRSADAQSLTMRLLGGAVNYVTNVRVCWLLLLLMAYRWWSDRPALMTYIRRYASGFVALAVSLGIVMLCGSTLERVAFYTDFLAMLLLLPLFTDVLSAVWQRRLVVVCCVVMLVTFVPAYMFRHDNKETWQAASEQMRNPAREVIGVRTVTSSGNALMNCLRDRYVMPSFEFGYYCCYMAFDATDVNTRCASRLFDRQRLVFLPDDVLQRMERDSTAYADYELDESHSLYIWRIGQEQEVKKVTFVLNEEDRSQLLLHQRLVAYDGDRYELDPFRYETVEVSGHRYLVFTRPTTNIYRRIHHVELE